MFDIFKKKNNTSIKTTKANLKEEYLDDITFIKELKHIECGPWHQYDVLIDARIYGWETIISWADYMAEVDLFNISEVKIGNMHLPSDDITKEYHENGSKLLNLKSVGNERGILSIAGISKTIGAPMKIVWINQSRVLRLFTLDDDIEKMKRYIESTLRRNFNTEDAMKLGKPQTTQN